MSWRRGSGTLRTLRGRAVTRPQLSGLLQVSSRSRARTRAGAGRVPYRGAEMPSVLRKHLVDSNRLRLVVTSGTGSSVPAGWPLLQSRALMTPDYPGAAGLYRAYGPLFFCKVEGFVPWRRGRPFGWFEDEPEEKAAAPWLVSRIWSSGGPVRGPDETAPRRGPALAARLADLRRVLARLSGQGLCQRGRPTWAHPRCWRP